MPPSEPGGAVSLFSSDAAILEAREIRKDVPCSVAPVKPILGFDLKFHAGYDVSVPLKELAGSDNHLTMVFRVAPDQKPDDAVYFSQRWNVPMIDADAGGSAVLSGSFDLGEGKYHIDWLMRDRSERVCSFNWDSEASLPVKDKQIALDIPASAVQQADMEPFRQEPPLVAREAQADPLNVKVIVNFAPQDSLSATLQPIDTRALLSILRNMAREPRITRFSIVAFNLQEQRVIYRQESAAQIDFPALGEALRSLNLGTVNVKRLAQKHGDAEFLTSFITQEIVSKEQPDAVIIAGLGLGGGAWAFSTGWLGYVNGMMGAYQAVANVNPADRGMIMRAADQEASVCWKFGTLAAASCAVFGLSAFAIALRRKAAPGE